MSWWRNTDTYTYGYGNTYCYSYSNAETYTYAENCANTKTSSYAAAETVVVFASKTLSRSATSDGRSVPLAFTFAGARCRVAPDSRRNESK